LTISTQNNHKNDNAQAIDPKSTIKKVDSSKEKTKHMSCSEHVAAGTAASEAEKIPKVSLKSSLSANTFDTKANDSIRTGEKSSKHKIADKDEVQLAPSKAHGKQNTYGNSNLKNASKEKAPIASFATVSAVRSLNSPIHQKPHAIPNKVTSEIAPSYPIPLHTPPPPVILSAHFKRNESVSLSSNKCNPIVTELKNNQEGEPLFHKNGDLVLDDENLSCQIGGLATKASDIQEKTSSQCNSKEIIVTPLNQESYSMKLPALQSTEIQSSDITPPNAFDMKEANGDGVDRSKDITTSGYVDVESLQKANNVLFSTLSDSCEIPSKNESNPSMLDRNNIVSATHLTSSERSSPTLSSINHDKTTVTNLNDEDKTAVAATTHSNGTQLMENVVSE